MILSTVKDLPDQYINEIESHTNKKVIDFYQDNNIDFSEIEILITYGVAKDWNNLNLEKMKKLKWIQIFQTGIENLPFDLLDQRKIKVTNVKDIYGAPISEYVMSYILFKAKEIERYIYNKKIKSYDRTNLLDEISGKTIGIFGTGSIGREVAKKAQAFNMNVYGFNSNGRPVDFFEKTFSWEEKHKMIRTCDYLVLLLPLVEKTKNFFSWNEFEVMKKDAFIINVGRGGLINQTDLIKAVNHKMISGAVLDVFNEEPLPKDNPLWETENIMITPHISGKSRYFFDRVVTIFNENYKYYVSGKSLNYEIDLQRKY